MSETELALLKERVAKLESCYNEMVSNMTTIKVSIEALKTNYDLAKLMIQWIIAPLVLILGALVGVKIAFPTL